MKNKKINYVVISIVFLVLFIGLYGYYLRKQNNKSLSIVTAPTKTIAPVTGIDTSSWTEYVNNTYSFSIKFPTIYEVQPDTEKQNTCVRIKTGDGKCVVLINVYNNKDGLTLQEYLNRNLINLGITGPLVNYSFNGYNSFFDKNQPGTNVFVNHGANFYRIIASTASSDKEVGDIVVTFKFVALKNARSDKAIVILQKNPSIQYIQSVITNNGRKAYLEPQNENGDVVEVSLIEGGFPDKHTARIDTFMVNVKTDEIVVNDVANNKTISLKDWGKDIIYRFPDYGPQKVAMILVQDGSKYGPPFDPNLYQLEISKSEHIFAKSDLVDLKQYLGKNITVHYREVKGVIMGEQQLVTVDSVE